MAHSHGINTKGSVMDSNEGVRSNLKIAEANRKYKVQCNACNKFMKLSRYYEDKKFRNYEYRCNVKDCPTEGVTLKK